MARVCSGPTSAAGGARRGERLHAGRGARGLAVACVALLASAAATVHAAGAPSPDAMLSVEAGGVVSFALPPGHKVVGHAEEGGVRVEVVPVPAIASRGGLSVGLEQARDCLNDLPQTQAPLTANALAPALPNIASGGECDGRHAGFHGPLHYFEFQASGDGAAWILLVNARQDGHLALSCFGSFSGMGAGVGDSWTGTYHWNPSHCDLRMVGPPPTEWTGFSGEVGNGHHAYGTAYAFAVSGVHA